MISADERVEGVACAQAERVPDCWLALLRRHLLDARRWARGAVPPRVQLADTRSFRGRIRSGRLGPLRYCHLQMTPHVFVDGEIPPTRGGGHMVVLQLAGTSVFSDGGSPLRLRPGEMLLIGSAASLRVEHQSSVEQIVLLRPLPRQQAAALLGHALRLCSADDGLARLTFRWIADACLGMQWEGCEAVDDVALALSRLIAEVLRDDRGSPPTGDTRALTRERIEAFIAGHFADPGLNAASIAAAFGCSVRTLHRAFQRGGEASLARCLWRLRVEACAAALRTPEAAALSLTDLALQCGFASPAHFSGLFRGTYGESPSANRRRHRQPR